MNFFITGGSRGIGADLVTRAAAAGHNVAFTYRARGDQAEAVIKRASDLNPEVTIRSYQLDVRNREQVDEVVDRAVDDFDGLEVIVNNAGISQDALLVSMSDEEWDNVIGTNLTGPFNVCRAVIPTMLGNRFGRIINISSVVAGGATGQANYAASKAGLHGLTKTIAKEYGRKGITANVVVPGFFETDMTKDTMPEVIRGFWTQYALAPKGRTGELSELSAIILFLASPESAFINGQEIRATAGLDWTP
jgi:NAD(P)-dependent dehydrogenase (short-subunit alcohol dehydrogenase family)